MSKQNRKGKPAAAAPAAQGRGGAAALSRNGLIGLTVFALAAFLLLCLTNSNNIKTVALVTAVCTVIALLAGVPRLRKRLTWVAAAAALWVLMDGISTLYAVSGKFALYEFLKVLISFGVFVLILVLEKDEETEIGLRAAMLLEGCTAFAGLFSIDLISTRVLSGALQGFLGLFTTAFSQLSGVEAGVRMTSFFDNPNIFAGCVGIGVLVSLGLAVSARGKGERRFHLICLAVNSLSFVLAFSMGATGMIAAAFLVYLILERKERRSALLILMLETLVLTLVAVFPIYVTAFDTWDGFQPVPLVCTAAVAALLILADQFVGQKLAARLAAHGRAVIGLIAAVLALAVLYVALALNVTGGVSLGAGESLRRSAYPAPGEYTLQVESTGDLSVVIESQNRQDTMMHTSTVIYRGDAQGASFTVPEDSLVLYFNFSTSEGTEFSSAVYQGEGGSGSIKLGYKLLPGFMANRLQGLFANQNAIQRVVFFEDGMKLFQRSPIVGLGMGAFENGYASVQSFYYTTRYVHNHYIQSLIETGVVGLVLFLGVLLTSAVAILKSLRRGEQSHPLTPALGACLVFMAGHAAVEVVFSSNFYLPLAFAVFALISLCCGGTLLMLPEKTKVQTWSIRVTAILVALYTCLLGGNMIAQKLFETPTYGNMAFAAQIDRFEWSDYLVSYVYNAAYDDGASEEVKANMEKYAQRLEQVDSNIIPLYLAESYFQLGRVEDAFRMLEKYVTYVSSDPETWQDAFYLIMRNVEDTQTFRDGVARIYQLLQDWNQENMGTITLDDTTITFIQIMT